jgi:hypothetical protein
MALFELLQHYRLLVCQSSNLNLPGAQYGSSHFHIDFFQLKQLTHCDLGHCHLAKHIVLK